MNAGHTLGAPDRVIKLLIEQRDLYRRLAALSARQHDVITADRPEALLNVLQERQTVVISLARINEQLAPFRADWDGACRRLTDDGRAQAAGLLAEINAMLARILKADREDADLLSARKQLAGAALDSVNRGQAGRQAYAPGAARGGDADVHV